MKKLDHFLRFCIRLTFASACLALSVTLGYGAEDPTPVPRLIGPKVPRIRGLKVDSELTIEHRPDGESLRTFVRIRGEYPEILSSLVSGNMRAKIAEDGRFELLIPITGALTQADILSIDAYGVTAKEQYDIEFPAWDAYRARMQAKYDAERNGIPNPLSISLGLSQISYAETQLEDYSATVMTGKVNYVRPFLAPRWNLGVGGFVTILNLKENYPAKVRFLGINARLGYSLIKNPKRWRAGIYFGAYYTTMNVKDNRFGFYDINGPQIFPVVRRVFNQGRSISFYLKFAPLVSNSSLLTFSSREIATGLEYIYNYNGGRSHGVQLDLSSLVLKLPSQTMRLNTVSLSMSYAI